MINSRVPQAEAKLFTQGLLGLAATPQGLALLKGVLMPAKRS